MRNAKYRTTVFALGVLLLATSCIHNTRISDPALPSGFIQPLPVTAAVIYDDSLRNFHHKEFFWGDTFIFKPGAASISAFNTIFAANFAATRFLDRTDVTPEMLAGVDVIIEPSIRSMQGDWAKGTIEFEVRISEPDGKQITTIPLSPGYNNMEILTLRNSLDVTKLAEMGVDRALSSTSANLMRTIRNDDAFRQWLQAHKLYVGAMPVTMAELFTSRGKKVPQGTARQPTGIGVLGELPEATECIENYLTEQGYTVVSEADIRKTFYPWIYSDDDLVVGNKLSTFSGYPAAQWQLSQLNLDILIILETMDHGSYGTLLEKSVTEMTLVGGVEHIRSTMMHVTIRKLEPAEHPAKISHSEKLPMEALVIGVPIVTNIPDTLTMTCEAVGMRLAAKLPRQKRAR